MITKSSQKEKIKSEIMIHKSLDHPYIVKFFSHFDDPQNIYIIMEICSRRSMMELQKRRKLLTEPEVRYYLHQLLEGCNYLHQNNIIHRDLKLGNIFLNSKLHVKIGDFGLATSVNFTGERKKTLCGTPNYIAPEILTKKGHSFEVDVWSIGCIIYTLLVGKAPFETKSLKETYAKIKNVEYSTPSHLTSCAKSIINSIFQQDPTNRPEISHLLEHIFFKQGYHPSYLPESCLTTAPQFERMGASQNNNRRPLIESNAHNVNNVGEANELANNWHNDNEKMLKLVNELRDQISLVIKATTDNLALNCDDAEDPASAPIYWISKWVDYSDKYGFAYQLCDNSFGALFNDGTQMISFKNGVTYQYIDSECREAFYNNESLPGKEIIGNRVALIKIFKEYMQERLLYAGSNMPSRDAEDIGRLPFLIHWLRDNQAIAMMLSNSTIQINFSEDHTKMILCPLMAAVTYIDQEKRCRTYRLSTMQTKKCMSKEIYGRLLFAEKICKAFIELLHNRNTKQLLR